VAPITRICKPLSAVLLLALGVPAMAAQDVGDLYWLAQRHEIAGRGDEALKSYAKLLAKSPTSEAAASNLFQRLCAKAALPMLWRR